MPRKMIKKDMKTNGDKCNMCGTSYTACKCKTWRIVAGLVAIILGIALWNNWLGLGLNQIVAILLVLIGIKKLVKSVMKC